MPVPGSHPRPVKSEFLEIGKAKVFFKAPQIFRYVPCGRKRGDLTCLRYGSVQIFYNYIRIYKELFPNLEI